LKQKKLAAGTLLILVSFFLTVGAAGISRWQQVNSNGFGSPNADEISAVEAFGGHLYAGTSNVTDGMRIFRSQDAQTWIPVTDPGFGLPHDTAPAAALDLVVFNGRLYASTGRGDGPGQIWRTLNGVNWAPVVIAGFGDPDTVNITALVTYNGMIYAGATNLINGAQIWRSYTGDSNSWSQVGPSIPGTVVATVAKFAVFDGALYAAVESDAPAQIWRSYGGDWTTIIDDGFGDSNTTATGDMAEFGDYLYVGAGNLDDGGQLWRSNNGTLWEQVIDPGFGDPNNTKVEAVFVFQNDLYASVRNAATGIEVWRTTDGATWEQTNDDGFGDSNNTGTNGSNASAEYLGYLHVGTANVTDGGELWQMTAAALYDFYLSPDDSQAGLPGTTVTYMLAITNSGNVTDSYSLVVTDNVWVTMLSASSIALLPGTTGSFSVSVAIPPSALATESDTAIVTATSQGDNTVNDIAVLTTECIELGGKIFLPLILRFP
jgi:hypothetical protein